jgi:ADP-ribose pyrophosphatase YjhB (NUDIX family)
MSIPSRFNIRVYFVIISEDGASVLVADEIIAGKAYTKFPGGGLEFGEGPEECVLREAQEELGQDVEIISHLYTTGFYIQSAFRPSDQVISIYYTARLKDQQRFRTSAIKHDFIQTIQNEESFRWMKLSNLSAEEFDFPADKYVAGLLQPKGNNGGNSDSGAAY